MVIPAACHADGFCVCKVDVIVAALGSSGRPVRWHERNGSMPAPIAYRMIRSIDCVGKKYENRDQLLGTVVISCEGSVLEQRDEGNSRKHAM